MIRKAKKSDVASVARIHALCFPENDSTKYGEKFLQGYYLGVFKSKNSTSFVCEVDNSVVGFIVGGVNKQKLSRQVLLNSNASFFINIFWNVLKDPRKNLIKYWIYAKNYVLPRKDIFYSDSTAALDSLAVMKSYRGEGIAKNLTQEFLNDLRNKDIVTCRLGVEIDNITARKFYEKIGFKKANKDGSIYIFDLKKNR